MDNYRELKIRCDPGFGHLLGIPPISIIGFGLNWLSSLIREPKPLAKRTTFIVLFI